ncbi:hypothetical protein ACFL35_20175 [Candidatus Riflebacteria bacterium]
MLKAMQLLESKRIFIVTGAFGSGKTEFSLNLAKWLTMTHQDVHLVDLDVINTYFRPRHISDYLKEKYNINVVASFKGMEKADIPALNAPLNSLFKHKKYTVIDVGGDKDGSRILGMYRTQFPTADTLLIHVFNPNRIYSDTSEKISSLLEKIEAFCNLKTDLLVANPNLGIDTEIETITESIPYIKKVAESLSLPLLLISEHKFTGNNNLEEFPIERFMRLPFEKGSIKTI